LAGADEVAWSEWVTLEPGAVPVRFEFARDGDADARFRAMWEMERSGLSGFVAEPIPSAYVGIPIASAAGAAHAREVARGRVLLGDLGCINCHASPGGASIARPAPDLSGAAQRADGRWMLAWISDPQHGKPGSGMPDVIPDSPQGAADAWAIVAFLTSLAEPADWPAAASEAAAIGRGRELYESVGCMACHGSADGGHGPWTPPSPFGDVRAKWNPAALAAFLREPHGARPAGRMPSLLLSDEESDLLATYLISVWGAGEGPQQGATPAQVELGRAAFADRGCASCHAIDGVEAAPPAKALAALSLEAGCLHAADADTPRYSLSEADAAALRAAIGAVSGWKETASAPIDHASLAIEALNCVACHEWHERGGVAPAVRDRFESVEDTDLGDEGRLPPRLGGVGWKLTSAWLAQVIGEGARARPYMKARMPVFPTDHAAALVDELALLSGVWPGEDRREPEVNDALVQGGLKLVGAGAFNCISCHVFADTPPAGVPGPDIARFGERLRYDWWSRYIHAPSRFKPLTRMPAFFAGGQTAQTAILGGEVGRQVDAMWAYFSLGELFMPPPEGIMTAGGLSVAVTDEPIVLRTFLRDVGARGVAVGFPAGVHFAYDAATARLAYAWTGSFLDAAGAWSGRGGSVVEGQGPTAWTAPPGPPITLESPRGEAGPSEAWSFRGYRLDELGAPTFMSEAGGVSVAETFHPYPRAGVLFSRVLEISGAVQGRALILRPGERANVVGVAGGSAEEAGGAVRVTAQSDRVRIELEVLP
ncbi:MAG TPA: c-type cytochrome, partial [Phycisphaerales bacterium]|nr:c-type cytochrome [Phycisphaerales bacterium]